MPFALNSVRGLSRIRKYPGRLRYIRKGRLPNDTFLRTRVTPSNVIAGQSTAVSCEVTWTITAPGATGHTVQQWNPTTGRWFQAQTASGTATAATVTGLDADTAFRFRVAATDELGRSFYYAPWVDMSTLPA